MTVLMMSLAPAHARLLLHARGRRGSQPFCALVVLMLQRSTRV
jgi:hypothetical protein